VEWPAMLTDAQRADLLSVARASIEHHLGGRAAAQTMLEELPDASGVFVTIKRRGELRGCLGTLQLRGSLAEEVARCARDSATEDPRFPPMSSEELPESCIEISILGPLEPIDPPFEEAVVIGTHGLVAEQGGRRGLLLPQVAVEWGWTPEQFLRQTCHKAGLPLDAWQHGARMYRFAAEVFGE
jgi:AmmeMemoRadiSam system protein A